MFDPMINEANGSSSACRLWRVSQVETGTPPSQRKHHRAEAIGGQGVDRGRPMAQRQQKGGTGGPAPPVE